MLEFILLATKNRFLKNTNLTPLKSALHFLILAQLFLLILHQGLQVFS